MKENIAVHNFTIFYHNIVDEIETPVQLGPSYEINGLKAPPCQTPYKAIWDTGATGTCVAENIAQKLKLRQSGQQLIQGVTGVSECNTYLVALHLPDGITIPELEVSGCVENIGCDVLIGMDVITIGDFAICNHGGRTSFSFRIPSVGTIDFTMPDDAPPHPARNAPCPCGSGKKYKKCHGALPS